MYSNHSKEVVKMAVEMRNPPRIPILFFNRDLEKSDIKIIGYGPAADYKPDIKNKTEWGFEWVKMDDTMGQPKNPPILSWRDLENYIPPNPNAIGRFDKIEEQIELNKNKYILASLGISGFNMVTFIRGFENTLEDLYIDRDNIERLIDMVFSFEKGIIENYGKYKQIDAISFGDDWGTQNSLMISPNMWRDIFKARYKEQFDLVHSFGKHVYFHSCGYIYDIIPDLIEIGVDILNLNQPDLFGIERIGQDFGGKVCFNCPVDHQTVAIKGSRDEIFDYVKRLNDHLGCYNGGFIGYIEEYHSVGMTEENYKNIVDAFESL